MNSDCPWLLNATIPIPLLANWNDPTRDCADWWVEQKIGKILKELFGLELTQQSVGHFPEWDLKFSNGLTVEIKIGTFLSDKKLFIETAKAEDSVRGIVKRKIPSGLSLSKAHYYLIISPGTFGDGTVVQKLRLIPTEKLRWLFSTTVGTSIAKDSRTTYGFEIDLHDPEFSDGCLGHFIYNMDTKEINFNSFVKYRKEIEKLKDMV